MTTSSRQRVRMPRRGRHSCGRPQACSGGGGRDRSLGEQRLQADTYHHRGHAGALSWARRGRDLAERRRATHLTRIATSVDETIRDALQSRRKAVCFVTGVPGAGKTLVGLDAATKHISTKGEHYSVSLSGNGPLVAVLQEALASDRLRRRRPHRKSLGQRSCALTRLGAEMSRRVKWSGRQDLNLSEPSRTSPDTLRANTRPLCPNDLRGRTPDSVTPGQGGDQAGPTKRSKGGQTDEPDLERLAVLWSKLSSGDRVAILALATSLGAKD